LISGSTNAKINNTDIFSLSSEGVYLPYGEHLTVTDLYPSDYQFTFEFWFKGSFSESTYLVKFEKPPSHLPIFDLSYSSNDISISQASITIDVTARNEAMWTFISFSLVRSYVSDVNWYI
jgi:hypothetical protein